MVRTLLFAFLMPALPFAASASELEFPLTGLRVVGADRVSEDLILAETGLVAGGTYTEQQLTRARRRLLRLPHLLRAEFALNRGDTYGTYVLVITVKEVSAVFFRYAFTSTRHNDADLPTPVEGTDDDIHQSGLFGAGAHGFWGPWWHWYAASELVQRDAEFRAAEGSPLDIGISHRNLFGRHIFFNFNLQYRGARDGALFDPFLNRTMTYGNRRDPAPTLDLALPFFERNQWLTLSAAYLHETYRFDDRALLLVDRVDEERTSLSLTWTRDTTDDLMLPRRGLRLSAGLNAQEVRSDFSIALNRLQTVETLDAAMEEVYSGLPEEIRGIAAIAETDEALHMDGTGTARGVTLALAAAWYHPLSWTWTGYVAGDYRDRLSEEGALIRDRDLTLQTTRIGVDYDLGRLLPRRPLDDLRTFADLGLERRRDSFQDIRISALQLGVAWRVRWGLSRLTLRFEDVEDAAPRGKTIEVP